MSEHLLKYLSTTRDRGLVYRRQKGPLVLSAYVDGDWLSDYGNDSDNRKCCTGYALMLGGAAVSWRSFKQQRVAGSSTESEYYSLWAAVREVIHTRRQMKECGFEQFEPSVIHEDNQAVKRLSEDVVESTRTRHWDKEYHQLREEFERQTMRAEYIDTKENAADVLTKGLGTDAHRKHTDTLSGLDWNADQGIIYQESLAPEQRSEYAAKYLGKISVSGLAPEQRSEYAAKYLGITSFPSQTDKKRDVVSSGRSDMNSQLKSEDKEVLIIDKTNWLELMKTVRGTEESPQIRQYVRCRNHSTPVVEIKGVRETYTPMEELD